MPEELTQLPVSEQVRQPADQIQPSSFLDKLKIHKGKILVGVLGILVFVGAVFGAYKLGQRKVQLGLQPTPTRGIVATPTPDPTANWKTYTNNVYSYTIKYPPNFKIGLCKDCNPPEIEVNLENVDKTISISIEYAHQFTLCANNPSPCIPTKNLKINVMGKEYTHEEYYIDYYKRYIFKIEDIERNRQSSQISISGTYNNVSYAKLIDQILSTFKFLEEKESTGEKVFCKEPRPEVCAAECITNPPYICGSDGKSYCSVCQACADLKVEWYVIQDKPCGI